MTTLLLDTRILLWWLGDDERLPERMRAAVADGDNEVFVSAASAWEMSIKAALGQLTAPDGLREELRQQGFTELPVTVDDGLAAGALPRHHQRSLRPHAHRASHPSRAATAQRRSTLR